MIGNNSVLIKILQPIENFICTRIKVQYSSREDFSIIIGEKVIEEWKDFEGTMGVNFQLNNMIQGRRYFFRAASGNLKGFGVIKSLTSGNIVNFNQHIFRDLNCAALQALYLHLGETLTKAIRLERIKRKLLKEFLTFLN